MTEVNMPRAELWARVDMGDGGMHLTTATIDGRPITEEERAELGASTLAELQAAEVLRMARIEGMNVNIAATTQLLELLAPWWTDQALTLTDVMEIIPADTHQEALVLLQLMIATLDD